MRLDGSYDNEFQAAYDLSRLEAKLVRVKVPEGKWAIIDCHTVYCPFTDAIIGTDETLKGLFDSEEEALKELDRNELLGAAYDDDRVYIRYGGPFPVVREEPAYSDSEIPF